MLIITAELSLPFIIHVFYEIKKNKTVMYNMSIRVYLMLLYVGEYNLINYLILISSVIH